MRKERNPEEESDDKVVIEMINDMLSDRIERFILNQLGKQNEEGLIVKRKDLAERLACAPSQITHVINTRFGADRRFTVESRRGSGGFIRISIREGHMHPASAPAVPEGKKQEHGRAGESIEDELSRYYSMLVSSGMITMREYLFVKELIDMFLEHCPEDKKEPAAKEAISRISRIIREGK